MASIVEAVRPEALRSARPVYFLHIPKCAGTSVRLALTRCFAPRVMFAHWRLDDLWAVPRAHLQTRSLIAGHFGRELYRSLGERVPTLTILRDPVARTVSHYESARRIAQYFPFDRVRDMTFDEFLADPMLRPLWSNYQARNLVQSLEWLADRSPDALRSEARRLWPTLPDDYDGCAQLLFELAPLPVTGTALLEASMAVLDDIEWVLACDRLDVALPALAARNGWGALDSVPHANVTPARRSEVQLDARTVQRTQAGNEVDMELYEVALQRQAQLLAAVPA
jgi:hypothetical protein